MRIEFNQANEIFITSQLGVTLRVSEDMSGKILLTRADGKEFHAPLIGSSLEIEN